MVSCSENGTKLNEFKTKTVAQPDLYHLACNTHKNNTHNIKIKLEMIKV